MLVGVAALLEAVDWCGRDGLGRTPDEGRGRVTNGWFVEYQLGRVWNGHEDSVLPLLPSSISFMLSRSVRFQLKFEEKERVRQNQRQETLHCGSIF